MKIIFNALVLAVLFFNFGAVSGADLKHGLASYYAKNFDVAVSELQPLADLGDPRAAFYLGKIFNHSDFKGKDDYKAFKLLSRASRARISSAATELISMRGQGKISFMYEAYQMKPEEIGKLASIKSLADAGKTEQMESKELTKLAIAYCEEMNFTSEGGGRKTVSNNDNVVDWFRSAAEAGQPEAQFYLGMIYLGTQMCVATRVKPDASLGISWLRKAAEQGVVQAQINIAELYINPPREIRSNFKEGMKWLRLAAEQGEPQAFNIIATYFYMGLDVVANKAEAIQWMHRAAELDDTASIRALGQLYMNGDGVAKSPEQGYKWFKKGAELGDPQSQYELALMHFNGVGTGTNLNEFIRWLKQAGNGGDSDAQVTMGQLYLQGQVLKQDPKMGLDWLRSAVQKGDPRAQFVLGKEYESGDNTPKDLARAYALYKLAIRGRYVAAQERYDSLLLNLSAEDRQRGDQIVASWRRDSRWPGSWQWRALSVSQNSEVSF